MEWARKLGLREAPQLKATPTWKACMRPCSAVLDRAWHLPASLKLSCTHTLWSAERTAVDHALVFVDLPLTHAGIGYAGACRGGEHDNRPSRVRADLTKLNACRDEWRLTVNQQLLALPQNGPTGDPFAALQAASRIADEVAQQIAPKPVHHSHHGDRRRPFAFRGHSKLQREIQWLHAARCIVKAVVLDDPALLHASERRYIWRTRVERLHSRLRRSLVRCPPELNVPFHAVLGAESRPRLVQWLDQALGAIRERQAIIRAAFERAIDSNLQRLRGRIRANPNTLTAEMILAALGRSPPKQRVWGLSGQVPVGVQLCVSPHAGSAALASARNLSSATQIVRVASTQCSIDLWFRGPRHLGDFLLQWCESPLALRASPVRLLDSPSDYVALLPDDMLAMQELYLARQGMATSAQCPTCAAANVQPIVTSAVQQPRGCPWRAVRYFCSACQAVYDRAEKGLEPLCPIPPEVWDSMRKLPKDMQPFLSRPMDMTSLQARLRKLPKGRAPGRDGIPFEYFKLGPAPLLEYLLGAVNACLSGSHPLPDEWLGGLVTMIPKTTGATNMQQLRPIANLLTAYKVVAAEITDRLMRTFEEYEVWHDSQEGARRGRGTRRQVYSLMQILEQGRREKAVTVIIQLDFNAAFTSLRPEAVYRTMEAYGVPGQDIALMQRMDTGSWYSVSNPFGETAACDLSTGMKQGCPMSPPKFSTGIDPLHHLVSASGKGWKPSSANPMLAITNVRKPTAGTAVGTQSDPAKCFVDDVNYASLGPHAVEDARAIVSIVEVAQPWIGPAIQLTKSRIMAIDFATMRPVDTSSITFKHHPLPVHPVDQPFKVLGVLMTLTLDHNFEKARVLHETRSRVAALAKAKFLTPSQREATVTLAITSVFRYSAGLVPWTTSELETLTSLWVEGYRGAWNLPKSDASLFRLSRRYGGRGCPIAHDVWITESMSLISQCLQKPGVVSRLMIEDLQRACLFRGCLSLYQLQRMTRLVPPKSLNSWVELLLSRLDGLGLDVANPLWDTPMESFVLLSEVVGSHWWDAYKNSAEGDPRCVKSAPEWLPPSGNACITAVSKLAAHGILYAAQLSLGEGLWCQRLTLPKSLSSDEYHALVHVLSSCHEQNRIVRERILVPGYRQLTLYESPDRASRRPAPAPRVDSSAGQPDVLLQGVTSIEDEMNSRRRCHPWQCAPRLPDLVTFDLSSDTPYAAPGPQGWELVRKNGSLVMRDPEGSVQRMEAAQAHMMHCLNADLSAEVLYAALMVACKDQQSQDETRTVHWNRHLLACIARITRAKGLIGCRSVTFHPHFRWYCSLTPGDTVLGAVLDWPAESGILILDAYPPIERKALLRRAAGHVRHVWVMRMAERDEASSADLELLVRLGAQPYTRMSKRSLTVHNQSCWCEAQFDAIAAKSTAEVWRLGRANAEEFYLSPSAFKEALGDWELRREDFHWPEDDHPVSWDYYRAGQQDFVQEEWEGLVAAVDGSVDRSREIMGAGLVVGKGQVPELSLAFPVGGPLATLRPEAAALEALVARVPDDAPLLVFVDCLVLLGILARWGQEDFWPDDAELKHFDIIDPCLRRLRGRRAVTRLVKVKSHSGILMNERADDLAELGCASEEEPHWPGPRKLDPLRLCPRDHVRTALAPFPDRCVSDKQLVRRASEGAEQAAAQARDTNFSREMLQDPVNCSAILATIPSQPDSLVRLWMQVVCGQYPTMARLHRMYPNKFRSANCTWCGTRVPETLCHFLSVCTHFHDARTAAHNRAWQCIVTDLKRASLPGWQFFVETTIGDTGLLSNKLVQGSGAAGPRSAPSLERFRNLRPDAVLVNLPLMKIAILDLTRPYDGSDGQPDQAPLAVQPRAGVPNDEAAALPRPNEGGDGGFECPNEQAGMSSVTTANADGRSMITTAAKRKMVAYSDLARAIGEFQGEHEWRIEVLPWVVGSRGVVDAIGISRAMNFLEIPSHRRRRILQRTVLASVQSLAFMHRVRISANSRSVPIAGEPIVTETRSRKRKRGAENAACTLQRWRRLTGDSMRANLQSARWRGDSMLRN